MNKPEARKSKGILSPARIWAMGFLLLFVINISWESANDLPPSWDMAHHQLMGLQTLDTLSGGDIIRGYAGLSDYYPPLYYLLEALVLSLFGDTQFLPLLANLLGLFLLSFFTFRTAEKVMPPLAAVLTGLLVLMLPMVAWTSRVSLLDTGLAGWVMLAFYLIIRSEYFRHRKSALLLGLASGAGVLCKWTFPFFLIVPVIYAIAISRERKRSLVNLGLAGVVGLALAATWYWPNAGILAERIRMTAEAGTGLEMDPGLSSIWGWIYYLRCLSGYYLFLPLTLLFATALYRIGRDPGKEPVLRLTAAALAGSVAVMTVLQMKDPRYILPAAPFLAILLMAGWKDRPAWSLGVIPLLALVQMLSASFPASWVPDKIALFEVRDDHSYKGMNREWVLFESDYFGILGRARAENWRLDEIINYFRDGETVAVVPEHPYINTTTLGLTAYRHGLRNLPMVRAGLEEEPSRQIEGADWIIGKSGDQGVDFLTLGSQAAYDDLEKGPWQVKAILSLPDRSRLRLWRNIRLR